MSNQSNSYQLIAWGQPRLWWVKLVNGVIPALARWKKMYTPKEGTTNVSVTEGEQRSAKVEGGKKIAERKDADEFYFNFDQYARTPDTGIEPEMPFDPSHDGQIGGEYAILLQPEYAGAIGLRIDKCTASVQPNWTAEEGTVHAFRCPILMPNDGSDMTKWQVVEAPVCLDTYDLQFGSAADSTGKVVTVENAEGTITATSSESWCTAAITADGLGVKVTVTANTGSSGRTALVTVKVGGTDVTTFDVTQAASE